MDEERQKLIAYQYLCRLAEAKDWIERCISENIPVSISEFENTLRNGILLAKLSHSFATDVVPLKRIYDVDEAKYKVKGLHFKHTQNFNYWIEALDSIKFPKIFHPETVDLYDQKNMPKVIYCIHAVALYCYKLGKSPAITSLSGKVTFTDEEILEKSVELKSRGVKIPMFNRIGGILTKEIKVDDETFFKAIVAVNRAIDDEDAPQTVVAMNHIAARLVDIDPDYADYYQKKLFTAKNIKYSIVMRRGRLEKVVINGYGEEGLLTSDEIQSLINQANLLRELNDALDREPTDNQKLEECLGSDILGLRDVDFVWLEVYSICLKNRRMEKLKIYGNGNKSLLYLDELQRLILQTNWLIILNEALDKNPSDEKKINECLLSEYIDVDDVNSDNIMQYITMLKLRKKEKSATSNDFKEVMLTVKDIQVIISRENALLTLDRALQAEPIEIAKLRESLRSKVLNFANLRMEISSMYAASLKEGRDKKGVISDDILRENEIQCCIDEVNLVIHFSNIIVAINEGLENYPSNKEQFSSWILDETLAFDGSQSHLVTLYVEILKRTQKERLGSDESFLNYLDIQNCITLGNEIHDANVALIKCVAKVNATVEAEDHEAVLLALQSEILSLKEVNPEQSTGYLTSLKAAKDEKISDCQNGWVKHEIEIGGHIYYNLSTEDFMYDAPEGYVSNGRFLTKIEIEQALIAENERYNLYDRQLPQIIAIQALARGYLARKVIKERNYELKCLLPAVIQIQAACRGYQQRRAYLNRLKYYAINEKAIIKMQSVFRCLKVRKYYEGLSKFYFEYIISSYLSTLLFFYDTLLESLDVPFAAISMFVYLLDETQKDFNEELELQKLRSHIVTSIRANLKLEKDLSSMDVKIGLLVKNRITLQDVVHQNRALKKINKDVTNVNGIDVLIKERTHQLEGYQSLFYLLQTEPKYLAKLIFEMPQSRSNRFVETAILTIFNYAANTREEFLLIKLFNTSLQEEVLNRVNSIEDIVENNPLVVKLAVQFNRGNRSQNCLKEIFGSVIQPVINSKDSYDLDPMNIYKAWLHHLESISGEASQLPHNINTEQALKYPEVKKKLAECINKLKALIADIVGAIVPAAAKLPYALRCVAMTLRKCLEKKFPNDKDIALKAVGHFIICRYMHPALIAPDAFDVIPFNVENPLTTHQRHCLASVASLLQRAAINNTFGNESPYLSSIDDTISESFAKLRTFLCEASTVEEPGERFQLDQYSEYAMLRKPTIYISIREICNIHKLVADFENEIAPNTDDPLREVLSDLGSPLSESELIGYSFIDVPSDTNDPIAIDAVREDLAKTEVCLTLTNRFDIKGDNRTSDVSSLFNGTKNLTADVIRVQRGSTLASILDTPSSKEESEKYKAIISNRASKIALISQVTQSQVKGTQKKEPGPEKHASLEKVKIRIKEGLQVLEEKGLTSSKNGYGSVLREIAKDILNRRLYRKNRKIEILRLREAQVVLDDKIKDYVEQMDYYNKYIKTCIENMALSSKKKKDKKSSALKYTAARLHEKNIVLSIAGLQSHQYKNVTIEIASTDDSSKFKIHAKIIGTTMDSILLDFEHLLELQYEGIPSIKVFNAVMFDVNSLIGLLNRKFYGKD
ncbi:uncharacterized protein TRIADDRAFT_37304 [Trichoplax adhaerens]|uniref:Ras-GAP domain-containing protein n=1 Tax=Trichoplax adhaerens TaxID=10228 RepID=B3RR54_TRIAD|nr:hypothetical protein TRIADDRAFT_37304 [Trichoplax adhaerens]EDV26283.1 hypothetical protein TRIADDRAFT_37304 [Trichoplax adhaerens]|eukprot:XP_002110279.1 hypothetical protein TRIADDRAFT_37304 [Trichoplax adhaerens]